MKIDIEACYKKYAPMVFRRCRELLKNEDEALDAAQDVFVNLLSHQNRLHGRFLSSLLYTMATNTCLNRIRRCRFQADNIDGSEVHCKDTQFDKVEEDMLMEAILKDESESTRAICYMYHRDSMTLKEISEVTGLSISGVRKKLVSFSNRVKIKIEGELL